jgi:hypothetical protein
MSSQQTNLAEVFYSYALSDISKLFFFSCVAGFD